jgi:hypothetical protein
MEKVIIGLIVALAVLVFLFFVLRELNNWYWKINERVSLQYKTNFLLEKISIQLGATDLDEITIEDTETGKKQKVKMDKWIEHKMKNPNSTKFKTVKTYNDSIVKNDNLAKDEIHDFSPKPIALTNAEQATVNTIKSNLNSNEIIVINPLSRVIKKILQSEFSPDGVWINVKEINSK